MFEVEWYKASEMEAAARLAGMPEGGSILDYIDDSQYRYSSRHAKWEDAVARARIVQPGDFFGDTHINKQSRVVYKDGPIVWETTDVWLFDGDELDPEKPHWTHYLELQEGDEVIAA